MECGTLNSITTSKYHHAKNKRAAVHGLNTKAERSMINSGLSVTGMQKFVESLEVSPVSARASKKRERDIGAIKKKVAKTFCLDATELG